MLCRFDLGDADLVAIRHVWKPAGIFVLAVIQILVVEPQEAVELDDGTIGAEAVNLAVTAVCCNVDSCAFKFRTFHLAGNRALPDQFIERQLISLEVPLDLVRCPAWIRGPDSLMCFLRVLGLGRVFARNRGQIGLAIVLQDCVASCGNCLASHVHAVGPHVGDEAHGLPANINAFVELLGNLHCPRRGKAKLARCFLLQCRSPEGRERMTLGRLAFH